MLLKVKVLFYNKEKGGRLNPVQNGYRASIVFGLGKIANKNKGILNEQELKVTRNSAGILNFDNEHIITLEQEKICNLKFTIYDERIRVHFIEKEKFIIMEPPKIVGIGEIIEVIEDTPSWQVSDNGDIIR